METRTFASSSSSAVYTAMVTDARMLSCTCRGWTMLRPGKPRHCKHTKELAGSRATEIRGDYVFLADAPATRSAARVVEAAPPIPTRAPAPTPLAPMLASAMVDPVTGDAFNRRYATGWVMEEKIDGHRCVAIVSRERASDRFGTVIAYGRPRAGKTTRTPKALPANIVEQLRAFPDGIYDGELVEVSAGKSWRVTVVGAQLVFVIFDLLDLLGTSLLARSYEDRREALLDVLRTLPEGQTAVTTVRSVEPSWAGVEAIWSKGGEGVILKRIASAYRPGHRSPEWVKVKASGAATLTITGFEAGKNGPQSKLCLRGADGIETTIKTPDNATLRAIAKDPASYIGRHVVISFQERTPSGSYRHPMFDHFAGPGEIRGRK